MVLLEQHMELGSVGITFGQPPFYAPPLTPIQALHNKCTKFIFHRVQKIKFQFLVYFADTRTLHPG
jgi:hypothetical protein